MAKFNTNISSSILKVAFTDDDGEVLASFRMNPADIKLAKRLEDMEGEFNELFERTPENATVDDVICFNDKLEETICSILGYDAQNSLFGFVSATSIMEDGNIFAVHVMQAIKEYVLPEIKKRKQAMANAVKKHTAKYST